MTDDPTTEEMTARLTAEKRRARCSVCKSDRRDEIHALRVSGMILADIEAAMRAAGHPIKRETLGKHFAICLGGKAPVIEPTLVTSIEKNTSAPDATDAERDFAILVRNRATQLLSEGALRVTATHGLQAQALLDRRAEKQADRDLALNMARLLSGAITLPPSAVIEGRVVDVTPTLLAPPDLVEP